MRKKWIAAVVAGSLMLGLSACASEPDTVVYVQNVGQIVGDGAIAMDNRYAGVVVSENVTQIQRDDSQKVAELFVAQGQDVKKGDTLFKYDSVDLSIQLDKEKLALEQLKNTSTTLKSQITQLKNEQKKADKEDQFSYTVEIQAREIELKKNEHNIKAKNNDISRLQASLANVTVLSPVTGRVVSVNEEGMDQAGNPAPYITIQQSGTYRIKSSINEMNLGALNVGDPVRIVSRADEDMTWSGTVVQIDQESTVQDPSYALNVGISATDAMTGSSKYVFYVEPAGTEGMILGQHVYMESDRGQTEEKEGLWLPEYYICYTEQGEPYVWAEDSKQRLEMRAVELGAYDELSMTYEIASGLTVEDNIAFPEPICQEGAGVTQDRSQVKAPQDGEESTVLPELTLPEETIGFDGPETWPETEPIPTEPTPTEPTPTESAATEQTEPDSGVASDSDLVRR